MRILINDFGGYPFPIQLSKFLAKNGYQIVHTYVSNIKTPHGNMEAGENAGELSIQPITLNTEFKKYSFLGRLKGEYEFANKVSSVIDCFKPDIFLSANTPLLAQSILLKKCKRTKIPFIYWCQDIHSIALESYLKKRLYFIGNIASLCFRKKEIKLLEQSSYVITISDDFNDIFKSWNLQQKNISTINNWGPLNEITVRSKINPWSQSLNIDSKTVILYSGTLGLKHNPLLISSTAKKFRDNDNIVFIIISEGIGADILANEKSVFSLENLIILPYQDYNTLSDVLGSADILISILEKEAALFSVPSKVLSYLCSKKPIILSASKENLSAKIILETSAGFCVQPGDADGFISAIEELVNNQPLRKVMGEKGRKYAEANFDIDVIAKKFEEIFYMVN